MSALPIKAVTPRWVERKPQAPGSKDFLDHSIIAPSLSELATEACSSTGTGPSKKHQACARRGWFKLRGGASRSRGKGMAPFPQEEEGTRRSAGQPDCSAPLTTKADPGEGGGILEQRGVPSGHEEGRVQSGGEGFRYVGGTGGVSEGGAGCWWLRGTGLDGEGLRCQGEGGGWAALGCVCGGGVCLDLWGGMGTTRRGEAAREMGCQPRPPRGPNT